MSLVPGVFRFLKVNSTPSHLYHVTWASRSPKAQPTRPVIAFVKRGCSSRMEQYADLMRVEI